MRKTNHRLKSNRIFKIRKEESDRINASGATIPNSPSLFNSGPNKPKGNREK